jgi:hypothetical protein
MGVRGLDWTRHYQVLIHLQGCTPWRCCKMTESDRSDRLPPGVVVVISEFKSAVQGVSQNGVALVIAN